MYRTRAKVKQLGLTDNMSVNKTKSGNVDQPSTRKKVELSPTWTDVANAELARASHAHSHPSGARPKTRSKGGGVLYDDNDDEDLYPDHSSEDEPQKVRAGSGRLLPTPKIKHNVKLSDDRGEETPYRSSRNYAEYPNPRPHTKPVAMPDTFHGKGKLTLSSWLVHFGIVSEINGWDDEQAAKYMALSLRSEALVAFTESIPGRTELTVAEIVEILKENFDRPDSVAMYRQRFAARKRRSGESLNVLRHDLVKLVQLAYPGASEEMVNNLARDQFILALESQHLRMQVRRGNPCTLEEALEMAIREEKLWKEEESQTSGKLYATVTATPTSTPSSEDATITAEGQRMQRMEAQIEQLTQLVKDLATTKGRRSNIQDLKCYHCKQLGHFRRDCPTWLAQQPPTPSPSAHNQGN